MKIPTISKQMFSDINKKLDKIREQMNEDVREKYFEFLEKKKGAKNESNA